MNATRHDEFRAYVVERGPVLLRAATQLTSDRAEAEDLLQAALAKTYLAWDRIEDRSALDGYVRRAMVNTQISWWRRRKLEIYPTDQLPDRPVEDHTDRSETRTPAPGRHAPLLRGHVRTRDRRSPRRQRGHGQIHRLKSHDPPPRAVLAQGATPWNPRHEPGDPHATVRVCCARAG
ncbi:hypothetical protein GCM10023178_44400 [Actinomadura luteofluorescens]